jgi:hypothetical protein
VLRGSGSEVLLMYVVKNSPSSLFHMIEIMVAALAIQRGEISQKAVTISLQEKMKSREEVEVLLVAGSL